MGYLELTIMSSIRVNLRPEHKLEHNILLEAGGQVKKNKWNNMALGQSSSLSKALPR